MDKRLLKERLNMIEEGIETVLEQGSENEDVLEIMKEILEATKVKNKISDYLD